MLRKALPAIIISVAMIFTLFAGTASATDKKCASFSKACMTSAKSCGAMAAACCAGSKKGDCASQCKKACAEMMKEQAALIKKISADIPYHESKRLVVEGHYVCGKCGLKKVDICQGFLKTDDGKLYPLVPNHNTMKMKGACQSKTFKTVTVVKKLNGVKYLEVKSFTVI